MTVHTFLARQRNQLTALLASRQGLEFIPTLLLTELIYTMAKQRTATAMFGP